MNNQEQMNSQAQKAYRISIGITIAVFAAALASLNIVITNFKTSDALWQPSLWLFVMIFIVSVSLGSVYLCRNGRYITGIQLLGGGLLTASLLVTLVREGRSAMISLAIMTLIIVVTTQTLPNLKATRFIALSIIVGVLNIILDLWLPIERIAPPDFRSAIILGIAAIILGVFVIIQYKTFNLQTKLFLLFISMPAIIIAIVSGFFILNMTNNLKEQIAASNQANLEIKRSQINASLDTTETDVRFLSKSVTLVEYLTLLNDNSDVTAVAEARTLLNEQFLAFAETRLIYDQIRFIDTTGQEIIRINTSRDGVSTIVAEENLQNKSSRPYFEEIASLSNGNLYISSLDLNIDNGEIEQPNKPVLRYGTPVFFKGERVGMIVTNVLADNFLSPLSTSEIDSFLVDADGYFLYHPDESLRWGRDLGTGITVAQEAPELANRLFSSTVGDSYESPNQFYAYKPIILPSETTPRWFLANFIAIDEAFAPIDEAVPPIVAISIITLMLTPLLAIFVSRSITAPVLLLTHSAKKLADGDFNTKAAVTTQDEIGILATTFNGMTAQLQSLVGSLEARVTERTQGLTLAAEVGGMVAQIHDLDELLINAVELVRSHFELYYTQVYLVDEKGQKLWLRAGTGEIGGELVRRGFSLPLGPGSINGTAVFNKKPIIVANTSKSVVFRPNALLPDTRSEMAVPLMVGERVVGVLDLQSDQIDALSAETLPAFEALASQLAIAIENANLFAEVARTRAEIEAQARRLVRDGWNSSLDGVHTSEHVGFRYEKGQFYPLTSLLDASDANGRSVTLPITVVGESIGSIQFEGIEDDALLEKNQALITSVARQVGQQIENLRLLEDAQRYQTEAEEAARRLIRDGWKSYRGQMKSDGYVYDQQEVTALQEAEMVAEVAEPTDMVLQPLSIQGEVVGMLEVDGLNNRMDEETRGLLTAVAQRLSSHIEDLRLIDQTQAALSETNRQARRLAMLNELSETVSRMETLEDIVAAVMEMTPQMIDAKRISLLLIDEEDDTMLRVAGVVGELTDVGVEELVPLADSPMAAALEQRQLVSGLFDAGEEVLQANFVPIYAAGRPLGTFNMAVSAEKELQEGDRQILLQIATILGTTIENRTLFNQTRDRANREQLINNITRKIQGTVTMESALQTAVEELGQAFQARLTQVELSATNTSDPEANGKSYDNN